MQGEEGMRQAKLIKQLKGKNNTYQVNLPILRSDTIQQDKCIQVNRVYLDQIRKLIGMYNKSHTKFQQYPVLAKAPYQPAATTLRSNMCQLKTVIEKIFKYSIIFTPAIEDSLTRLKRSIVKGCSEVFSKTLGNYVHSGNDIYSFKKIPGIKAVSKTIDPESKQYYEVTVEFCKEVSLRDVHVMTSDQVQELEMVFNIYLRKVMESQKLLALQRNRYFNLAEAHSIAGTNLNSVTGYFLSISAIREGLYLTIDTVNEFFRKTTCLEEIKEMQLHGYDEKRIVGFFRGKRVSLLGSKGKTLRVLGVNFSLTPATHMVKPENIPIAKQWEAKYKVKVHNPSQPLLRSKKDGETIYLIPEFCYITGMEEEAKRFGKGLSDLSGIGSEPMEKDQKITGMFDKLRKGHMLEEYGLIMSGQARLPLQMLPKPQLSLGGGKLITPDVLSRGVRIMNPINFDKWLFMYEARNYESAENLYKTMCKASGALGVSVKEPEWVEFDYMDSASVDAALQERKSKCQFVFALLSDRRKQYKAVKKVLDISYGIISQCAFADYKKMTNMTYASNLIRQLNAKLGGDLYSVELPPEIPKNTMFVGVDVCHCGRGSVVGFYSNAYTNLAKCYCETTVQKKGQEIVSILVPFYANALKEYQKQQKVLPDYIFIYRDGVSRAQRDHVLQKELPQLKDAITHMKPGYNPQITLVVVNKRVHQRFLAEIGTKVDNPEPGTIVETEVTENGCDNFFMISAKARKGTIRPTHYYIAHNERKEVTKRVVQTVSYAMAFMYYNTPWSVKIPAQITLADKKAYYVSMIEGPSNKKLATTESFLQGGTSQCQPLIQPFNALHNMYIRWVCNNTQQYQIVIGQYEGSQEGQNHTYCQQYIIQKRMAAVAATKSAKWMEKINRKLFIGGNWKCNGTIKSVQTLVNDTVNKVVFDQKKMEILVSPIFVHLFEVKKLLNKKVHLSAQNISPFASGPFTGEISAQQLKDFGIDWTLIGHSERRTYFKESNNVSLLFQILVCSHYYSLSLLKLGQHSRTG
eukprot:TRINITY_DN1073_c0_g1_i1.p1 TRINITY_DN1073_c0_g1~~TRINITY_DN1073_c0_g1_i1.p1  ORF type:complete len:1028 (-),score=59.38 TRINITY_DN1073_c0_g1_i1:556-3639(-)